MSDHCSDWIRDAAELRQQLDGQVIDLRLLDLAGFRRWLDLQMARWQKHTVFLQRTRIRDLRRAHPQLRQLERDYDQAKSADAATPEAGRLQELDRRLHASAKAITGLTSALASAPPEHQSSMIAKRDAFRTRQQILMAERDDLVRRSPSRWQFERIRQTLDNFRVSIGLDREQACLADLIKVRGRRSGAIGAAFEREAFTVTHRCILPAFDANDGAVHVLGAVRLGAAGVELDVAVVRRRGGVDEPVDVLAVVEAKRNINDLAHGFLRRQIDLTWLTGDVDRYDPAAFRTGHFRAGHFDRPAVHWQDGQPFVFAPDSFQRFSRDPASGYFLDHLYLLTRAGPVWGVSSAALSRIATRVATDEDWEGSETAMSRLFDWCRSLAGPFETPDVLRLMTATPQRARHVLMARS